MAYIWSNYSEEKKYRAATSGISPYLEVWDPDAKAVSVNLFYRLQEILLPFLDGEAEKMGSLMDLYEEDARYQDIANIFLHYIAQIDRLKGMTEQDLAMLGIYCEIENGHYGEKARQYFRAANRKDRLAVARYVAKYDMGKQREMQWDALLKTLFGQVALYYEKSSNILYVYIHAEKNEYNENLYKLAMYFLKDMDIVTEVLWRGGHFGIVGIDDTMIIDSLALI